MLVVRLPVDVTAFSNVLVCRFLMIVDVCDLRCPSLFFDLGNKFLGANERAVKRRKEIYEP